MTDTQEKRDAPGPKSEIAITILPDGRVVFGDLTPELAQVRDILSGDRPSEDPGNEDEQS